MTLALVSSCKSIVLTSKTPDRTAAFYRDVCQIPLEEERHKGTDRHWAGQLGDLHVAVHQLDGFWLSTTGVVEAATIVSFSVDDIERAEAHLVAHEIPIVAKKQIGPMRFIAVHDPDGRYVCFGTPWSAAKSGATPSRS